MKSKQKGDKAESIALAYLKGKGYRFLSRNKIIQGAEVDLVMENQQYVLLVEVKSGARIDGLEPFVHFTNAKKIKYEGMAQHYLNNTKYKDKDVRVDLICVYTDTGEINHFENIIEY
ncbi:MAG: YraN family protein [Bdellovibrionales bacterium]|nr:YraN family protein [Bdellovibrionales bacterium]